MFDHNTISSILGLSFWGHLDHTLFLLGIIVSITTLSLFLKFGLFYVTLQQMDGKKVSFIEALWLPFEKKKEFFRLSVLRSFGFVRSLGDITSFGSHLKKLQKMTEGTFQEEYDEYESPEGMLLIPLIIEKDMHTVEALKTSVSTLEEKFGKKVAATYSLFGLEVAAWIGTFLVIGGIMHFILGYHPFPTIITCSVIVVTLLSILTNTRIIFEAAVYNYCKGQPTGVFSQEYIESLFETPEQK